MNQQLINISLLSEKIKEKRGNKGYLKASREVGVSHNVLHQIDKGNSPSLESYIRICDWLELPTDFFTYRFENNIEITSKDNVIQFIKSDKSLNPFTADALVRMIDLAYLEGV